jgi:hypothetical protein
LFAGRVRVAGEQGCQRREPEQPGRDGGGRLEAGQDQQQIPGLREPFGRERVKRQIPGALHRGARLRTGSLDIGKRRGQLDAVQGAVVAGEAGPSRER